MGFHKNLAGTDIHVIHAFTFTDETDRNAAAGYTAADIGKAAKQTDDDTYYILINTTPTWKQMDPGVDVSFNTIHRSSDGKNHSDVVLNNTHRSSDGKNHSDVVLNTTHRSSDGSDHDFIDQSVVKASSPTFIDIILTGDLIFSGTAQEITKTVVKVADHNIELGVVTTPTDVTADGGGITLKGNTDKTINWLNATDRWTFNQDVDLLGNNLFSTGIMISDTLIAATSVLAGNLQLSGNTLSPTNANGDIILAPIGMGEVSISSNIIIGSTSVSPDGALHIHVDSSGLVTANSSANALVIEDSKNTGISILTPDVNIGRVVFATPSDDFGAFLSWNFSGNDFSAGPSKAGARFRLLSDQEVTNLTLSGGTGSELATFAKDVTINGVLSSGSGVVKITDQLEIEGATSQLLLTDTDNDKTFIVKSNLGDFSIVEVGGNNAFKILGGAAVNSLKITSAQVEIGTRLDVGNLRLDANTISSRDTNGNILLTPNGTGNVGIGASVPDTKLHVEFGTAGVVTPFAGTTATFESSGDGYLSILTPDINARGILFGEPTSNIAGAIIYNGIPQPDGFEFRVNGFQLAMSIASNLSIGIGESTPDTKLHVTSGSAGVVESFVGTIATFESAGAGYLSILTPDASTSGILFGEPSHNVAGGIFYNDPGSQDGFQFRVNGNQTKMVIEKDGAVGIGTTNPDITAILDLSSTTLGFLPPRMTTTQRDDIAFPLSGLKIHNTTVDKAEVFTGTSWKTVLTEDLGQVVVQETFASTNVRFFGEFGVPQDQGWIDTATGTATIDLQDQTVFGVLKQVVRHNDNTTGGSTTSKITLTAQNWIDINTFGDESFGGVDRLDTVNGANGFFAGLQANAAENPLATGNRRYGILFASNAGNLRLTEADNTGNNVTMDGTGGNPSILFDEWFLWECIVPAGLGAAEVYVNGILTTFVPTFIVNGGGLGTQIIISSGSTGGAGRVSYHDNFGATIFEESATKTLAAATMAANVAQINIPEGRRAYRIILPDGGPRPMLRLVVKNIGGSISLENQNPAAPEILYNGVRNLVLNIAVKEVIDGINTVDASNIYTGFKVSL